MHRRLDGGSLELSLFGAKDSLAYEINDGAISDPRRQGELRSTNSFRTLSLNWTQQWSPLLDQEMVLGYTTTKEDE